MTTLQEAVRKLEDEFLEAQHNYERWEINESKYHLADAPTATEGQKCLQKLLRVKRDLIKDHLDLVKTIGKTPPLKKVAEGSFIDEAMSQFEDAWNTPGMQEIVKKSIAEMNSEKEI